MTTPETLAPCADLVAAVAAALKRFRDDPTGVARAAAANGVAVEVMEAALVANIVADWIGTLPAPTPGRAGAAGDIEATRAAVAAGAGRPVTLAVRTPPLLAIRLVELAAATGTTPEGAAFTLLADGADAALTVALAKRGRPAPRPWNGGSRRGP